MPVFVVRRVPWARVRALASMAALGAALCGAGCQAGGAQHLDWRGGQPPPADPNSGAGPGKVVQQSGAANAHTEVPVEVARGATGVSIQQVAGGGVVLLLITWVMASALASRRHDAEHRRTIWNIIDLVKVLMRWSHERELARLGQRPQPPEGP